MTKKNKNNNKQTTSNQPQPSQPPALNQSQLQPLQTSSNSLGCNRQVMNIQHQQIIGTIEPINMKWVSIDEYNKLVDENKYLREQAEKYNLQLENHNTTLKQIIETKDKTIEDLRKENEELKNTIKKLEAKIDNLERKDTINKYKIAIQDLNRHLSLEKNIKNNNITNLLNIFRQERNGGCHFISDDDNDDVKTYKQVLIYNKLLYLDSDPSLKIAFDADYPNLIRAILSYIESNTPIVNAETIKIDERLKNVINKWWL